MPVSHPPRRAAGGDLIADLFEAMHDLHFQRDAIEGAAFCLAQAMEKLPSRAGFVHFYDIDRREFVLASAAGAGAQKLLLQRNPEQEPVLLGAMRQRRPVISSAATAAGVSRFATLGVQGTVLTAPVMVAGRFLAAIELADPSDGEPFNDGDANALAYIAEQFAEYLSSHGIVLDAQRISQAPRPA
jgi:GAF domain-containing protein